MREYIIEIDGINDCETNYYNTDNWWELVDFVQNILADMGGGHAHIYNEHYYFIEDIEV